MSGRFEFRFKKYKRKNPYPDSDRIRLNRQFNREMECEIVKTKKKLRNGSKNFYKNCTTGKSLVAFDGRFQSKTIKLDLNPGYEVRE